jgi:hypothetical protein
MVTDSPPDCFTSERTTTSGSIGRPRSGLTSMTWLRYAESALE